MSKAQVVSDSKDFFRGFVYSRSVACPSTGRYWVSLLRVF